MSTSTSTSRVQSYEYEYNLANLIRDLDDEFAAETRGAPLKVAVAVQGTSGGWDGQPDRRLDRVAAERCYEEMLAKVSERGGAVIIAEIGGEPAGFIAWHVEMDDAYIRDDLVRHADIAELYVAEPFRRQGLARVLLAKAERMIREAGLPRYFIGVLDGNDGAAAAYRQAGFKPYLSLLVKELD